MHEVLQKHPCGSFRVHKWQYNSKEGYYLLRISTPYMCMYIHVYYVQVCTYILSCYAQICVWHLFSIVWHYGVDVPIYVFMYYISTSIDHHHRPQVSPYGVLRTPDMENSDNMFHLHRHMYICTSSYTINLHLFCMYHIHVCTVSPVAAYIHKPIDRPRSRPQHAHTS